MPASLTDADKAAIDERLNEIVAALWVEDITASVRRLMALLASLDPALVLETMPLPGPPGDRTSCDDRGDDARSEPVPNLREEVAHRGADECGPADDHD